MDKKRLRELIEKFNSDSISDDDLRVLKEFLGKSESENVLDQFALEASKREDSSPASEEIHRDRIFNAIYTRLDNERPIVPINRSSRWMSVLWRSAAAVLFFMGFYFITQRIHDFSIFQQFAEKTETSIQPGGAKAKLLLDDGRIIDLETLRNDTLIQMNGYVIRKSKNGNLTYVVNSDEKNQKPRYNTIFTPKGGEYTLNLPDGTKIWINASSKLRYPLDFASDKREVELTGEAYFEVAKFKNAGKSIPFFVHTDHQNLEVLGTSFNINSYGKQIETTLVEGKIKVSYPQGQEQILSPNQQAIYHNESKKLTVGIIDPFYVISWKNGSFSFQNTPLSQVMESLSRWYDVEIDYNTDVSNLKFTGTLSKYEKINKVLQVIELTESVKFKIQGRRIMVM